MYGAEWCSACRQAKPIIMALQSSSVAVTYIDIDRRPDLKEQNRIRSIPVFIVKINDAEYGTQDTNVVVSLVRKALK
jgi:thioredoxin-like negative regulator of GroEL